MSERRRRGRWMRVLGGVLSLAFAGCSSSSSGQPSDGGGVDVAGAADGTAPSPDGTDESPDETDESPDGTDERPDASGGVAEVVRFETSDGLTLEADYYPAQSANRGAVVLLHQIPPSFDRSSYPVRVLEGLSALDVSVLNVDRRGAGASDGDAEVARQAYDGPDGRRDVEAAVAFLLDDARAVSVDASRIVLVGASNGTTTTLDYTLGRYDAGLPQPAAIIWLSPGAYTENQFAIDDHRDLLEALPILWHHPDSETWSRGFEPEAPSRWRFVELPDGRHGTGNFDSGDLESATLGEINAWVGRYAGQ